MEDTAKQAIKSRKRSASYPAFDLEQVIEAVGMLKAQLGNGSYSRESAAVAMGYKGITGSSGTKIAACVQFGLLIKTGSTYAPSELSQRILNPVSAAEKQQGVLEAVMSPTLYAKLFAAYDKQSLPLMLENILTRNYGIIEASAKDAAATFKKSAEYAGVLKNGVLSTSMEGAISSDDVTKNNHVDGADITANNEFARAITENTKVAALNKYTDMVIIPDTEILVRIPSERMLDLMMDKDFRDSVNSLKRNISKVLKDGNNDESNSEGGDM